MTKLIDLSHTIKDGLVTYKGLPAPIICDYLSREQSRQNYSKGTEFNIAKIEMVANTGTYLDAPFHRYEDGADIAELALKQCAQLPALMVDTTMRKGRAINESYFQNLELKNKAVLVQTGWDKHWNSDQYYENHPYLTESAAQFLKDNEVKLVGIDSHNIDNTDTGTRPAHSILLGHGILIVEHLTKLNSLPNDGFLFSAVPPKVAKMGTFPVRAHAIIA